MNLRRAIKITNLLGDGSLPSTRRPPPSRGPGERFGAPRLPQREGEIKSVRGWAPGKMPTWRGHLRPGSTGMQESALQREGHALASSIASFTPWPAPPARFAGDPDRRGVPHRRHFRRAVGSAGRIRGAPRRSGSRTWASARVLSADSLRQAPTRKGLQHRRGR